MQKIIKSSIILTLTEVFLMGLAILRIKIVAVKIGPAGLGVYGLLNSFFAILMVISASWMCAMVVKYIAEYKSNQDYGSINNVINITLILTFLITLLLIFVSLIFREYIIETFFNGKIVSDYYVIFSWSCLGYALKTIFNSLLQGLLDISATVRYRVVTSFIEIFITILMVLYFDLIGFIISFVLSSIVHIIYIVYFLNKQIWYRFRVDVKDTNLISKMLAFGKLNIFLSIISSITQYYQRIITTINLNILYVGYFQASQSVMNYMGILNRSTTFMMLPSMSAEMNIDDRNIQVNDYLRFTILSNAFISVITVIFSQNLIKILFASSFVELDKFMLLFVLAQFLISIELIFQAIVLGMSLFKLHLVASIINIICWLIVPIAVMKLIGFTSIPLSLLIASFLAILVEFYFLKKFKGLSIEISNYVIFGFSILLIILPSLLKFESFYLKLIEALLLIPLFILTLKKKEKVLILSKVKEKLFFKRDN